MTDSESSRIPVDPAAAQLLAQCGDILISVAQRKFGILAILHNIENGRTAQLNGVKRCSVRLPNGLEVSVWKDDLTTHRVDAVVNAANENLQHGAGLAGALSEAGGPEIQWFSDKYVKKYGRVITGEAICTSAGKLPCKAIIHAVGPRLSYYAKAKEIENASPYLQRAVESILRMAEEKYFRSVAIPALSSGLFNFPLDRCAEIIVRTVKHYHYAHNSQLSEVRLVNHDQPTVSAMESAFRENLESKASYSRAVMDDRTSLAGSSSLKIGGVTMHIKTGRIEEEKVDVIVNTISSDLDLSKGEVSKAILNRAGPNIQKDVRKKTWFPAKFGDIIETPGHSLHCEKVYHTVCAFRRDNGPKILCTVVRECLQNAVNGKYSTISFPAIGTGNLDFNKEEVAKLMIGEVADFAKQHKGRMLDVYFVLFPKDVGNIKAFEQEMVRHEEKQSVNSWESSSAHKGGYVVQSGSMLKDSRTTQHMDEGAWASTGEQPYIELRSVSRADHREAQRWITDLLHQTSTRYTIFNNHILHFGEQEHAKLLSFQGASRLSIREFLQHGQAGVTITGPPAGVREAALRVEALCCDAQEEFALTEESAMMHSVIRWRCHAFPVFEEPQITGDLERARLAGADTVPINVNGCNFQVSLRKMEAKDQNWKSCRIERICLQKDNPLDVKFHNESFYQRTIVNLKDFFKDHKDLAYDLEVVKIEKVENPLLEHHFRQKERQVSCSPKLLYQRVPAQFCDMVCRVGFHRQLSPPKEQKYGAGIYFAETGYTAKELTGHVENEEYVYLFQAKVLTGKNTRGSPTLIIPPARGSDPLCRYDSVWGGTDTHVIFNSHQALPVYLFTCRKTGTSV